LIMAEIGGDDKSNEMSIRKKGKKKKKKMPE
jgi:hypothetical protein